MSLPEDKYAASRPKCGDSVYYRGQLYGTVDRVEERLCYVNEYTQFPGDPQPFIWVFKDGLNNLFDWSNKNQADEAPTSLSRPWRDK